MKIIGFTGPKGSGKDTVAKFLRLDKRSLGKIAFATPLKRLCSKVFNIDPLYFNDPDLKDRTFNELSEMHFRKMSHVKGGIILNKRHLRLIKEEMIKFVREVDGIVVKYNVNAVPISRFEGRRADSPRHLLQMIGTDLIRDTIYENWHIEAAFSPLVLDKVIKEGTYCVTDIRFVNEFEALKKKFGKNFVCFYVERSSDKVEGSHKSEIQCKDIKALLDEQFVIKNDSDIETLRRKVKDLEIESLFE